MSEVKTGEDLTQAEIEVLFNQAREERELSRLEIVNRELSFLLSQTRTALEAGY